MPELTIKRGDRTLRQAFETGALLSDVLRQAGIEVLQPCGGRGRCGKCAVTVEGEAAEMTDAEKKAGTRLCCQTRLTGDYAVTLSAAGVMEQI